jgi:signal transduction histidine kinase
VKATSGERRAAGAWAWSSAAAGVVLLLAWTRRFEPGWLMAATVAWLATLLLIRLVGSGGGSARRPLVLGTVALALGLGLGGVGVHRFRAVEFDWDRVVAERQRRLSAVLQDRMDEVVERGRAGAELGAAAAAAETSRDAVFAALESVQARSGVDAVAVFTGAGDLFAWAGEHRGQIPDTVRGDPAGPHFAERPLFSYLYFTAPVKERDQHVVSAVLVETGQVMADAEGDADRSTFDVRTDARATFRAGAGQGEGVVWSLVAGGETVVHARVERVSQSEVRGALETLIRRSVVVAALLSLVILSVGWIQRMAPGASRWWSAAPLIVWACALTVAPLGSAFGLNRVFGPAAFLLPIPGDLTLGMLLSLLLPLAALVATYRPRSHDGRRFGIHLLAGLVAIGLGYPVLIRLLLDASTPQLLEGGARLWFGLQFAGALLLAVLTALALPRRTQRLDGSGASGRRRAALLTAGGIVMAGLVALVAHGLADVANPRRTWSAALWVVPFCMLAVALAGRRGTGATATRWLVAVWLGATAVLPHLWTSHQAARLASAERDLTSLGVQTQPILDYLLEEFANEAVRRSAAGEQGIQLLYRSWVATGLAAEPFAAWITVWSPADTVEYELRLGGIEIDERADTTVRGIVAGARDDEPVPFVRPVIGLQHVTKVMTAPFDSARMLSVAMSPRRSLERTSMVAPFLGARGDADVRLDLVEASAAEPTDTVVWSQTDEGWETQATVQFPEGDFYANLDVRVPGIGMQLARALLVIAFDVAVCLLLWAIGNAARGMHLVPRGGWTVWLGSFRARVTIALFLFFVGPTVLFGWVAYRALAREVDRTARTVAERAVRQAVLEFPDSDGDLRELATHAGSEVLYYYNSGELGAASTPEAVELGVYAAWMDPATYRPVARLETNTAQDVEQVGQNSFLLAFHRLRPAGILAVPMSLSAGDAGVRQRELAHLIAFAVLIGALLSLALSVAVGRQLAGPIASLRKAATAVGAGHLRVRLPEPQGEFGQLFASFNRMVRRLRRARVQELRSARVLAWGEMARQIAHEIKNPLTPIKLSVQHLRRAYRDRRPEFGEILDANVDQILIEIDRLSEIARAFSRYGAPGAANQALAPVDVAAVIHESLTLYRAADSPIAYEERVEEGLPAVEARPGELKEVLLNLLENARGALDGRGTITVAAGSDGGGGVEVAVADDGPGIPADLLPRIFEPHFSTRSTGTGLGLAIVRRIVESWGGTVTAESESGRGTVVRVRLRPAEARAPRSSNEGRSGHE